MEEDNEKKLKTLLETKKQKQENEKNALELKIQATYNQFKRDRALEVQSLLLKFKNKVKELESKQKREIAPYEALVKNTQGKLFYFNNYS